MTSKSGKRNKRKGRPSHKSWDQSLKMSPKKQARKTRHKAATYIEKLRPRILEKNARHVKKEYCY